MSGPAERMLPIPEFGDYDRKSRRPHAANNREQWMLDEAVVKRRVALAGHIGGDVEIHGRIVRADREIEAMKRWNSR
jgi:hypothetical protein